MADHDQRFKDLLKEFFPEFFQLFLAEWADRLDFSRVEWLQQEVFPDPPKGKRRSVDLLAKLPTLVAIDERKAGESQLALVHVETESGTSVEPLRRRMFDYYAMLRQRFQLPVLPVALYLDVGLDGLGWDEYHETVWNRKLVTFSFPYIGLPALDAEQHVAGDNPLGFALAALMKKPKDREGWLKATALGKIIDGRESTWRKFMLADCLDEYLPLDDEQKTLFDSLIDKESAVSTKMGSRMRDEPQQLLLRRMLEKKFGTLSATALQRLEKCRGDQLITLGIELLAAGSLEELGLEGPERTEED